MDNDTLYQEAKSIAKEIGYASVSLLQRKMRIGFTRAARLIDSMVAEGILEKEPDEAGRRKIVKTLYDDPAYQRCRKFVDDISQEWRVNPSPFEREVVARRMLEFFLPADVSTSTCDPTARER